METLASTLQNLLDRDADCRCGNMQLTDKEKAAIATSIKLHKRLDEVLKGILDKP